MKNEYTVTKNMFISWAKIFYISKIRIFYFSLALFLLLDGLFMVYITIHTGNDIFCWIISAAFILFALYSLFFSRTRLFIKEYKRLASSVGASEWIVTVEFNDDGITESLPNSTVKYSYGDLKRYIEKEDIVLIFLNDRTPTKIYKSAFVEGSWEECKAMLDTLKVQKK